MEVWNKPLNHNHKGRSHNHPRRQAGRQAGRQARRAHNSHTWHKAHGTPCITHPATKSLAKERMMDGLPSVAWTMNEKIRVCAINLNL